MIRLALTLFASLLLAGCSIFGDDDEPIDPPAELTDFEEAFRVSRVWEIRIGGGTEFLMLALSPAVDGGRIYAGAYDGRVIAVDAESGRRVWAVDTDSELSAGPAVGEGLVVFGTTDGQVIALDALEGSGRWKVTLSGEVLARPAVGNGMVIVRTVDGYLRALDAADGSEFWNAFSLSPVWVKLVDVSATASAFWRLAIGGVIIVSWLWAMDRLSLPQVQARFRIVRHHPLPAGPLLAGSDGAPPGRQSLAAHR